MNDIIELKDRWERVGTVSSTLGEGPIWDSVSGDILWVDIAGGDIHRYATNTGQQQTVNLGQKVGAVALHTSGGVVAALKSGIATVNWNSQNIKLILTPETHLPDNRFNDGKCDPAGRFWAGTMSEVAGVRHTGKLYALEKDYSLSIKIKDVSCSNGLAWNKEQDTFYYIDTPTRQVAAYDYELESGEISNRRIVIDMTKEQGVPDGMSIDTEGMLWIAQWGGWKVSRWNPFTGQRLMDVLLPAERITSCVFGGPDLQDLYITSANIGLDNVELEKQPLAGSLFVVKNIGYTGIPTYKFQGDNWMGRP